MFESLSAATGSLGALAGYIIAKMVPDETSWYPKWFFTAALAFAVAGVFVSVNVLLGAVCALVLAYGIWQKHVYVVAIAAGIYLIDSSPFVWELVFLMLTFATGYLYSQGARKQLWWLLITPLPVLLFALQYHTQIFV